MGRPLYSRTFTTTPAVRDPEPPVCEKWSYLNSFDPDSDEFFDNENAVYEDFVDPVLPAEEDDDDDELERDMLVVRMGNASPITSESSSLSDSESPLAVATENTARLVADALQELRHIEEGESQSPAPAEPAVHVRLPGRTLPGTGSFLRRGFVTRAAVRMAHRPFTHYGESLPVPPPSAPIPVPTFSRRSAMADVTVSPSTPPRQTPMAHLPMSPPPTSTPTLYSWARNPTTPSSGSPFTNPHARTSYTHLSPVLIRIRDVTV